MKKDSKKRKISGIEWDDDVAEMIELAKADKNFNLGEAVNAALRTYGPAILREMALEQKRAAERTLDYLDQKTTSSKKR